ncbi:MAG: toll/interleukin-1 receptor domain-containing protein [Ferruginibacter sp.]
MKKVFINYSSDPEDKKIFESLYMHLGLIRDFDIWHSGKINAGAVTEDELSLHLKESEVVIPLLSVNYLNNNFCMTEFASAKQLLKELYPVLISSFDIDSCEVLKDVDCNLIPESKSFIETSSNIDEACMEVCKELRCKVLGEKLSSRILNPDSRRFLYLLAALPIVLGLGYGAWCYFNDQVSSITYLGSLIMISISLVPIIKLLLPTNSLHKIYNS